MMLKITGTAQSGRLEQRAEEIRLLESQPRWTQPASATTQLTQLQGLSASLYEAFVHPQSAVYLLAHRTFQPCHTHVTSRRARLVLNS
jgi:hypothetical protein